MPIVKGLPKQKITLAGKEVETNELGLLLCDKKDVGTLTTLGLSELSVRKIPVDPTRNHGAKSGFQVGTLTQNDRTGALFACVDSTEGHAVHEQVADLPAAYALLGLGGAIIGSLSEGQALKDKEASDALLAATAAAAEAARLQKLSDETKDDLSLLGSGIQPATFTLADGSTVSLGDVVNGAFAASRLKTAKEWNALDQLVRENHIEQYVQTLDLLKDTDGLGFGKGA